MHKPRSAVKNLYILTLLCACFAVIAGPAMAGVLSITNVFISYSNSFIVTAADGSYSNFSGSGTSAPVNYAGSINVNSDASMIGIQNLTFGCNSDTTCSGGMPSIWFIAHGSGYAPNTSFSLSLTGNVAGPATALVSATGNFRAEVIRGNDYTPLGTLSFTDASGPLNLGPTAPILVNLSTSPVGEFDVQAWFQIDSLTAHSSVSWGVESADIHLTENGSQVPEPASAGLIACGLAGLAFLRLKRRA